MPDKMRILLIEDNLLEVKAFEDHLVGVQDAELVGVTGSGYEAVRLTEEQKPDAVILDLELRNGSGLQYLLDVKELNLTRPPYVLVTTRTSEERTLQNIRDNGGVIQDKRNPDYVENGPRVVLSFLRKMRPYFSAGGPTLREAPGMNDTKDVDEKLRKRISETLGIMGITSGPLSHTYLVEAILLGTKCENGIFDFENFIYPAMESKFHAKRGAMERLMRDKLEKTWSKPDKRSLLERYYTQVIDPEKAKPELREFISYYAIKFR